MPTKDKTAAEQEVETTRLEKSSATMQQELLLRTKGGSKGEKN